ncbi:hypothetical protein ACT3UJ_06470 [Halomonas sp. 86]|uniref:hypothetical protein n=1 Tax=unclassified Halomonas TaxID=2609666 RepID=UPI004034687C
MKRVISGQRASYQPDMAGTVMLDYSIYFDDILKETIDVCVLFSPEGHEGTKIWGAFQWWLKDFDSRWLAKFWDQFLCNEVFRRQVKRFYGIKSPKSRASYELLISEQLDRAALMMKAQGFPPLRYLIGGASSSTVIYAESLPKEVLKASYDASFDVHKDRVAAGIFQCQPIANLKAGEELARLMDDWCAGRLQPGCSYSGWRQEIRSMSLVPSDIKIAEVSRVEQVQRIIDQSNNGTISYAGLSRLRSGRDQYSTADTESMLSMLALKEKTEVMAAFNEIDQRKILRWMCRGLPEGLAIQKVLIDNHATENQRLRSKAAAAAKEHEDS